MSHILIQERLFKLIYRLLGLIGGLFKPGPSLHGKGDVVALAAGQPALAGLHAGELLECSIVQRTLLSCSAAAVSRGSALLVTR